MTLALDLGIVLELGAGVHHGVVVHHLPIARNEGLPHGELRTVEQFVEEFHGLDLPGLAVPLATGLPTGTKLQVAVRPERLALAASGVAGRLAYRENLGADLFLHVALECVTQPVILRADPALAGTRALGDSVTVGLAAEHLLLFDAEGRVIGVNGRASFEKRGRVNVGVGYAISSNQLRNFLGCLKTKLLHGFANIY